MSTPYMPGWQLHRVPTTDVIDHDRTADCICGPAVTHQPNDHGPDRWTYTHHKLGQEDE